jgi:hypothetical protein
MTKWKIFEALASPHIAYLRLPDERMVILLAVERESGDGCSFNLRVKFGHNATPENVFVRTVD